MGFKYIVIHIFQHIQPLIIHKLQYRTWTVIEREYSRQSAAQFKVSYHCHCSITVYYLRGQKWWVSPCWLCVCIENCIGRKKGQFGQILDMDKDLLKYQKIGKCSKYQILMPSLRVPQTPLLFQDTLSNKKGLSINT